MYLSLYADLHNYDKTLTLEHFYHPLETPILFTVTPHFHASSGQYSPFCLYRVAFSGYLIQIKCVFFCD